LGAFSRFLRAKTKLLAVKSRPILEVFTLQVKKKVLDAFSRFLRPKTKVFPVKFKGSLEVLCLQVLQKNSGRNFTSCASKNEAICYEVQTHFGSPLPCKVYKNSSGLFFSIFSSKSEVVYRCAQMHSGCSQLARFTVKSSGRNFMIYDLYVRKRSGLPLSSDAIWKLSPFKLYKKSSGRIFSIYASKNEAVCREIQTHFGSSLPVSFTEKVVGAIPRFVRPKTKLLVVNF